MQTHNYPDHIDNEPVPTGYNLVITIDLDAEDKKTAGPEDSENAIVDIQKAVNKALKDAVKTARSKYPVKIKADVKLQGGVM
jgi:hypothetical protein